ncbi:MAG: hypothetical protein AAGA05_13075 [Pseudomonadota bacterium]
MTSYRSWILSLVLVVLTACAGLAQQAPIRVLWWNANPGWPNQTDRHRQMMADHLTAFGGGGVFVTTFVSSVRSGALAQQLGGAAFDVVVIDVTNNRSTFNAADLEALKGHYASGNRAIMLDGSLWIRSGSHNPTTNFPGKNGATGALLVNQIRALADAGGGTLIGTDHNSYQVGANAALAALIPGARFTGYTKPSTDGSFIGRTLLAHQVPVRAIDILEHWQSIPSQGEVPVGSFTDFTGQPLTLYNLVETADQPGGGVKLPYVSASFDPGSQRTAIDSREAAIVDPPKVEIPKLPDNMPTRKGPPT